MVNYEVLLLKSQTLGVLLLFVYVDSFQVGSDLASAILS